MTPTLISAVTVKGTNVRNPEGEDIGNIEDLMIDWRHGIVAYAVLSFGGFLGMGTKWFAIPMESFQFDTEQESSDVILPVKKEDLENAPGFDKDNWPQYADQSFVSSVYIHYGIEPYWDVDEYDRA